jgi:hypothetical protein
MATILESLKSISGYPVPLRTFEDISVQRGLSLNDITKQYILNSTAYRLAKADVMRWVSFAPNINQEGISFDLLYSDREQLRKQANAIYFELGDNAYIPEPKPKWGYKGNRL